MGRRISRYARFGVWGLGFGVLEFLLSYPESRLSFRTQLSLSYLSPVPAICRLQPSLTVFSVTLFLTDMGVCRRSVRPIIAI